MKKLLFSIVSSLLFCSILIYAQTPVGPQMPKQPTTVIDIEPKPKPNDPLPPCHGQEVSFEWCNKHYKDGCEVVFHNNHSVICKCGRYKCPIKKHKDEDEVKCDLNWLNSQCSLQGGITKKECLKLGKKCGYICQPSVVPGTTQEKCTCSNGFSCNIK